MSRLLLASILALIAEPASASVPASAQQVFCQGDESMLGTVLDGSSQDCRLTVPKYASCEPSGLLGLTIKVKRVVGDAKVAHVGEVVTTNINVRNDPPKLIGDQMIRFSTADQGTMDFPLTGGAVTDADVARELVGKDIVLSLHSSSTGRRWSRAWTANQFDRLNNMWTGPTCVGQLP